MSYEDESDLEFYDPEDEENYNKQYLNTLNNQFLQMPEDEASEVKNELNAKHNFRHSRNGVQDAEFNLLSAKNAVREEESSLNPHTRDLLKHIDKSSGPGEGKKTLRRLQMEGSDRILSNRYVP